jgi:hypothetical protein
MRRNLPIPFFSIVSLSQTQYSTLPFHSYSRWRTRAGHPRLTWSDLNAQSIIRSHHRSEHQVSFEQLESIQRYPKSSLIVVLVRSITPPPQHPDIMSSPSHGILLPIGATITHGLGAIIKSPFSHLPTPIPVTMHELSPGLTLHVSPSTSSRSFAGQLGFIDFDASIRLPRHVHIAPVPSSPAENTDGVGEQHFTSERILVLNGVAMVELNAEIYVIPPRTLVTIPGGVPHTWTAAPKGVRTPPSPSSLSSSERETGVESDGTFLMVYEYEEVTGFYPTKQSETLKGVEEYVRCDDLEGIRFPALSKEEVDKGAWFVWNREVWQGRHGDGKTLDERGP